MKTITFTRDGTIDPLMIEVPGALKVGEVVRRIREGRYSADAPLFIFREDSDDSLSVDQSIDPDHLTDILHVAHRKLLAVTVHYQQGSFELSVPPSTRVRVIRKRAVEFFNVDKLEAPRLMLIMTGDTEPLDVTARIGSLTDEREISLDLVPHSKLQG